MDKIAMAVTIIMSRVKEGGNLDTLLKEHVCPAYREPLTSEEQEEVRIRVIKKLEFDKAYEFTKVEDPALIVDPEGHEEWYPAWIKENATRSKHYYWSTLKDYLEEKLQRSYAPNEAGEIVKSIDTASHLIVSNMEKPERVTFHTKGLAVGYVQSGKTANFTAVIAKAVDAGYRLIVVLTGIHNSLRQQTQERLDCELTGEPDNDDLMHVPVPELEYRQWARLTNHDYDFDKATVSKLDVLANYRKPMLVVMKKNCTVMERFISWLEKAPDEVRNSIPLLLIDDEADQASIDCNYSKDTDPTQTNKLIRKIVKKFNKHAYIGYTATPFANVLIDMNTNDSTLGRDLYPRNFVVALPRPKGYMGAEQIFSNGQGEYFVRHVKKEELPLITTSKNKDARLYPRQMTDSLEKAIMTFCLCAAARYERGQQEDPMTMLIHTTRLQVGQNRMKSVVKNFEKSLKARWKDINEKKTLYSQFEKLWYDDMAKYTNIMYPDRSRYFEQIEPYIESFLDDLQIYELNAKTEDKLDYSKNRGLKVIAIGGNSLSRGLTLEGLTTSFYLRKSQAYDTMLQMGRWFGYRRGYDDLVRIFTSQELSHQFEDLALVEEELRNEIFRYQDERLTPLELSIRLRAHKKLKITAPNKMGAATLAQSSFSDRLAQTIWFPLDKPEILSHNLNLADGLIKGIHGWVRIRKDTGSRSHMVRKVKANQILEFLKNYKYVTDRVGLDPVGMIDYIERHRNDELAYWNVMVVGKRKVEKGNLPVPFGGLLGGIIPVVRSRVIDTEYKVGVLSSPHDMTADLSDINKKRPTDQPLLVLYRVWKDSEAENGKNTEDLFKGIQNKEDVLGFAIAFPKSKLEPNDYFSQTIRRKK